MMKYFLIIYLWKFGFFVKLIQCEINTTINLIFPVLIVGSGQNVPLTEQAIYDWKNNMRKTSEMNDFDDSDYSEDEDIEIINQTTTIITTSETIYANAKSSLSRFQTKKIVYLLLLLVLIQTNK